MKIYPVSLGCAKNRVDTETALGSLDVEGQRASIVLDPAEADILFINTCAFIEEAVNESVETILEMARDRREGQRLVVAGCLVNRYGEELVKELPEVDFFVDTRAVGELGRWIAEGPPASKRVTGPEGAGCPSGQTGRWLTTPPWRAYVKISEGCSNRCTYCLIPGIRGRQITRPAEDILKEVQLLAQGGIREITLVAQDLTAYHHEGRDLSDLLGLLATEGGCPWIRLLYLHPARIDRRLLETIGAHPEICPYLDIPVQHASSSVLRAMGRGYDQARLEAVLAMIREVLPQAALRTTVMVGFPGETPEDFAILEDFVDRWRFDHLGCFVYSDEDEAPAFRLPEKVASKTARARQRRLMKRQERISGERNAARIGTVEPVLIEGTSPETELLLVGRTRFQAPEIDGVTYINAGFAEAGQIAPVRITEAHPYDLVGEIAGTGESD